MSTVLTRALTAVSPAVRRPAAAAGTMRLPGAVLGRTSDSSDFVAVLVAYRSSGGIARGDDLAQLLHEHRRGDYLSLARLIASGGAFGFKWRHTLWIPMFQFEPLDLSPEPAVRRVLSALGREFDDWRRACWFAEGNVGLDDRRPAEVLDADPQAVIDAAHADRLIASGSTAVRKPDHCAHPEPTGSGIVSPVRHGT